MAAAKKEKTGPQNKMQQITGYEEVERFPSGVWALDHALGGGIPVGRIIGIWGMPSMGKSTLSQILGGTLSLMGRTMHYVDAESSIDPEWAHGMGIQDEYFKLYEPEYLEQAYDGIRAMCTEKINSGKGADVIVLDSMAALSPLAALQGSQEDALIGLHARVTSQFFPSVRPLLRQSNTTLIMITQMRNKIGVMYGNPLKPFGGEALGFFASINIQMMTGEKVMKGNDWVGNRLKGRIEKNKTAPTKETEFFFNTMFAPSAFFDSAMDVVDTAMDLDLFTGEEGGRHNGKSNSLLYFLGEKVGIKSKAVDRAATDLEWRRLVEEALHEKIHERGSDVRGTDQTGSIEVLSGAEQQPQLAFAPAEYNPEYE